MELRPYQRRMAHHVRDNLHGLYFVDVGLGKTAAMLSALPSDKSARTLAIAPREVARSTWPVEAAKWRPDLRVASVVGWDPPNRREVFEGNRFNLVTMNYDLLDWLNKTYGKRGLARQGFEVVVLDEVDKLKSNKSTRFKAFTKLRPSVPRVYGMTGTPASENLLGLWAETHCVDGGATFGRSFARWRDAFFDSDYMGWVWTPKPATEEAIFKAIAPFTFRLSAEDAGIELPEVVEVEHPSALEPEQGRVYRRLEAEFIAHVRDGVLVDLPKDDEEVDTVEAPSRAILSNKLRQVTSGFAYRRPGESPVRLGQAKRAALEETIDALAEEGKQLLVAYWWKDEEAWLRERGIRIFRDDPEESLTEWSAGRCAVMAIHPASAGHGLNLQLSRCEHLWFMTLPWSLGLYTQTVGRLKRSGGAPHVRVHLPITRGTIDEVVVGALREKRSVEEAFLRRFRA